MRTVATLALHVFREQVRNRTFLLLVLFGAALLYASLLLGLLAVDEARRVLLDIGLGLIELTALGAAVYGASTAVLEEMQSKTIYLVLTRPISKSQYLAGRFAGLVLGALAAVGAMATFHLVLLLAKGWGWDAPYVLAVVAIALKVVVAASLAMFFALISTSVLSAITMTAFLWLLGHFLPEIAFLVEKSASSAAWLLKASLYLAPNLQLLNLRDLLGASAASGGWAWPFAYAALYSAAALGLSLCLFERKEF